jgi:hypothetical protein
MPTLQATKLNGSIIEKAKWEVESLNDLDIGHQIQISIDIKEDSDLISYVSKRKTTSCVIEKEEDNYSIVLTCVVKAFRHMLDASGLDSMAIVVPLDRAIEGILTYILNPDQCNPKFVAMLKNS